MSTLDEGLMATLTQEERDAMKEDDTTTESVDVIDQPVDEAKSEEVARTEPASDKGRAIACRSRLAGTCEGYRSAD